MRTFRADVDAPLELREDDVAFVRQRFSVSPQADLSVSVCPTCAYPTWRSTAHDGTGRTVATLGECCEGCEAFRTRHPEVFAFATTFHAASRFIAARLKKLERQQ